jgi:hypothetical protein
MKDLGVDCVPIAEEVVVAVVVVAIVSSISMSVLVSLLVWIALRARSVSLQVVFSLLVAVFFQSIETISKRFPLLSIPLLMWFQSES